MSPVPYQPLAAGSQVLHAAARNSLQVRRVTLIMTDAVRNGPSRRAVVAGLFPAIAASEIAGAEPRPAGAARPQGRSVLDFGAKGDGRSDDTQAIQAALDASPDVYIPGDRAGRRYLFTQLMLPASTRLHGDGPRASVLRQVDGPGDSALRIAGAATNRVLDITEGAIEISSLGVEVKTKTGLAIGPGAVASMFRTDNLRLVHQHAETLKSPPYTHPTGSRGIAVDGGEAPVFLAYHHNLEIRSFSTAIHARNTVNEWHLHGWFIDCQVGLDLANASTWMVELSFETGVSAARMLKLSGAISNLIIDGGRCEITQPGGFMIAFDEKTQGTNIRIRNPNMLINGDGGAWPGRKYAGTLPQDVVFDLSRTGNPLIAASPGTEISFTSGVRIGGLTLGDGKLTLGRMAGAGDAALANGPDGRLRVTALNGVWVGAGATAQAKLDISDVGVGFHGTVAVGKQVVTGARKGNPALESLLKALESYGLITDHSVP